MESQFILVEHIEKGIYLIKLNRPNVLNSLNREMMTTLAKVINFLSGKNFVASERYPETPRAIILTGEGRAFCAGVDLSVAIKVFQGEKLSPDEDPAIAMKNCKLPIIGAIHGFAITGGFELALATDILFATESCVFQDTHAKFGIMPSWGLSQKLSRAIGIYRAKEVSLSARPIKATLAYEWGFVNRVFSTKEQMIQGAIELAKQILQNNPQLVLLYKKLIDDGHSMDFKEAMDMEQERAMQYYKNMPKELFDKMKQFIQSKSMASKM